MTWFELTPSSTNDRKCFLDFKELAGKLIIVDLGYWDYGLLLSIQAAGGYYLSRIKSNSAIVIEGVVSGLGAIHIGKKLSEIKPKKGRQIVELSGSILFNGCWESIRVVGFWNPTAKRFHWYCTNLMVSAKIIYPLYRIRWQCELIFKACKRSLNVNRITTNNENIIESLILASLVAHLSTSIILEHATSELDDEQVHSISFQRIAKVATLLANDFVKYLLRESKACFRKLMSKMNLLVHELYDPNFRKRKTSLNHVRELLMG